MRIQASVFLILYLTSIVGAATTNATNPINDICTYHLYPVFAGGSSDELIRCMEWDPTSNLIIAGGKTTSNDFAPA
jgi:hypothetical protein